MGFCLFVCFLGKSNYHQESKISILLPKGSHLRIRRKAQRHLRIPCWRAPCAKGTLLFRLKPQGRLLCREPLLLPPRAQDPGLCLRLGTGLLTLQKSALGFICVPQNLQSQLPERGLLFLPDLSPGEQVSRFVGQRNERPGRPRLVSASGHCDFSKQCFSSLSVQKLVQTGARNSSGTTRSAPTTASMLPGKMRLFLCQAPLVKDARMCRRSAGPPGMEPSDPLGFSPGVSTVTPARGLCYGSRPLPDNLPSCRICPARGLGSGRSAPVGCPGGGPGLCGGSSTDVRDDSGFHLICVSLFLLPLS